MDHGTASYYINVNKITVNFAYQEALTRTKMTTSFFVDDDGDDVDDDDDDDDDDDHDHDDDDDD